MNLSLKYLFIVFLLFCLYPHTNAMLPAGELGDVGVELSYTKGTANFSYSIIYVVWVENETEEYIQNLYVCNRLITGGLTGTALPYWKMNKYPNSEVDGVTGATQRNTDFSVSRSLADNTIRQFTLYFEVDHSFDGNAWFYDQPALLYAVDVDLDNLQAEYTLLPVGWTRNDNLGTGGSSNEFKNLALTSPPIGELQSELRYITHQADGVNFGDAYTNNIPATNIVGSLTAVITVEADTVAPSVPEHLVGLAVSDSEIELGWSESEDNVGVSAYLIYRDGVYLASSDTNSYYDAGLSVLKTYSYAVTAIDDEGNESEQSTSIDVTTLNETIITLTDQVFDALTDTCYGALQQIVVAGNSTTVEFQSGSFVNLIAGQNIQLLPGTSIQSGANVSAYISTTASFCEQSQTTVTNIKSIEFNNNNVFEEEIELDKIYEQSSIKVYPNPSSGALTIKVTGFNQGVQMLIYNSLGEIMYKDKINSEYFIDIGNYKRGLYFLKFVDGKDCYTKKIMLQ